MTYLEYLSWVEYRNKYGIMDTNRRLEHITAMLFYHLCHGKVPLEQLFFFSQTKPQTDEPISLERAMQEWR